MPQRCWLRMCTLSQTHIRHGYSAFVHGRTSSDTHAAQAFGVEALAGCINFLVAAICKVLANKRKLQRALRRGYRSSYPAHENTRTIGEVPPLQSKCETLSCVRVIHKKRALANISLIWSSMQHYLLSTWHDTFPWGKTPHTSGHFAVRPNTK